MWTSKRFDSTKTERYANMAWPIVLVCIGTAMIYKGHFSFGLLLAVAILAAPASFQDSLFGFYAAMPLLFIFGPLNQNMRVPIPFFNTPVDVLIGFSLAVSIMNFGMNHQSIRRIDPLFQKLIFLFMFVAFFQALIVHQGSKIHSTFLNSLFYYMWPFWVLVLALNSSKQVRKVLVSLFGTLIVASLLWMPAFLYMVWRNYDIEALRRQGELSQTNNRILNLVFSSGLFEYSFVVPYATLISIPIGFFVLIPRYRSLALFSILIMAIFTSITAIGSALLALILSMLIIFIILIYIKLPSLESRVPIHTNAIPTLITVLSLIAAVIMIISLFSPMILHSLQRVTNPLNDKSGQSRIELLRIASTNFLKYPVLGNTNLTSFAYLDESVIDISHVGSFMHDSVVTFAAAWGLLFSIPYLGVMLLAALRFIRLARLKNDPIIQAISLGMASSIISNVIISFLTPNVITSFFASMFIWIFIGLLSIWTFWLSEDSEAELIA